MNIYNLFFRFCDFLLLESVSTSLCQRSFLLSHFIFRCLIQFIHLDFIRGHAIIWRKDIVTHSPHVLYLLAQVFSSRSITVIFQSMTVNVWSFGGQRAISVIRSGLENLVFKVSNNASRPKGGSKQVFISKNFIVILLDYDFSSKLCFEENSSFCLL